MKLVINRKKSYIDYLRSYKVYINGSNVGTLKHVPLIIDVPNQQTEIQVKVDWLKSNKLVIDSSGNNTVKLTVENNHINSGLFMVGLVLLSMDYTFNFVFIKLAVVATFILILIRYFRFRDSYLILEALGN